jgi:uncharacterized membrane protein
MKTGTAPKSARMVIHLAIVILAGTVLGLFFWSCKYNEYLSLSEICRSLAEAGGAQRAALRGLLCLTSLWLVFSSVLKRLRRESFCVSSGEVAKSFLPFLFFFPLYFSRTHSDFVVIAFIFSFSLAGGLLVSLFVRFEKFQEHDKIFKAILLFLIVLASAWFMHIVLMAFNDFRFIDEDFAVFDTSIHSVLRGQCLRSSLHAYKSQLGCHFSPILFLIAPFYFIYDNPRTLIFFQVVPVISAAFIVYLLAKERLQNPPLAFCFGAGYLLLPHVQAVAFNEFHAANMIPPFVLLTFYFLVRRRFKAYWASLLLMISCREELFLTGAAIGILSFFLPWKTPRERTQNRRAGLATFFLCLIVGAAAVKYIIPFYADRLGKGHPNYPLFGWLGETPREMVNALFCHPGEAFKFLFLDEKWGLYRWQSLCFTFLPMLLLPFFGKITFLLPFVTAGVPLMSQSHYLFRLCMQYSAGVSPTVAISAIWGAGSLIVFSRGSSKLKRKIVAFLGQRSAMTMIGVGLLTSCLMYSRFFGYLPFSKDFDERGNVFYGAMERPFRKNMRIRGQSRVILDCIKMIPKTASVCTQLKIGHHLGHHPNFQRFWGYNEHVHGPNRCEYVLLNMQWRQQPPGVTLSDLIQLLYAGEYGALKYEDWILLLKSNHSTEKNEWAYREIFLTYDGYLLISTGCPEVRDSEAIDGRARFASPGKDEFKYVALSRYRKCIEGDYKIDFLMKTDVLTPETIARIDCIEIKEEERQIIAVVEQNIRGTDFDEVGRYKRFSLSFDLPGSAVLQFRAKYLGHAKLWVDRIQFESDASGLEQEYNRLK